MIYFINQDNIWESEKKKKGFDSKLEDNSLPNELLN